MREEIELKSEAVNELLTAVPKWIVRWGISVIFLIIFAILTALSLIGQAGVFGVNLAGILMRLFGYGSYGLPVILALTAVLIFFMSDFKPSSARSFGGTVFYFSILNFKIPLGACTSAISPFTLPNRPLPIGEEALIFPAFKSASFSPTIW